MTEREKLIKLLKNDNCPNLERCYEERVADYLIENGVHMTFCETCEYIKRMNERGSTLALIGKPFKYCPECGDELE